MAENDEIMLRLCELLVNAAEVIQKQQQTIQQLGGVCDDSGQSVINEIGAMVG